MRLVKNPAGRILFLGFLLFFTGCSSMTGERVPPPPASPPPEKASLVLGPGDEVELKVFRHPEFDYLGTIEEDGTFPHPALGRLKAAGLSPQEFQQEIMAGLREYLKHPRFSINIKVVRSRKIVVLGEVQQPKVLPVREPLRLSEVIASAGGFRREARQTEVVLIRPGVKTPYVINLRAALREGDFSQDVLVFPGDIVYVPESRITNWDRFFMHLDLTMRSIFGLGWIYYTVSD